MVREHKYILVALLSLGAFLWAACNGGEVRGPGPGPGGGDTNPPSFTALPSCTDPEGDFVFTCTATGSDDSGGNVTYTWSVTAGSLSLGSTTSQVAPDQTLTDTKASGTASTVDWDLSGEADGTYTISVTLTDQAGNTSAAATAEVTKAVVTNQPPSLSDITVTDNGDGTFDLSVTATDPDGDQVTYDWSADAGTLAVKTTSQVAVSDGPKNSGEASTVVLTCPAEGGDVNVSVTATDSEGNTSDPATTTVSCAPAAQNRDLPANTFSFWLLDKNGNPLPTSTGGNDPEYDVQSGECYWLVAATGEFGTDIPANVDAATLATYTGNNAFADAVIDFVWGPQGAISLVGAPGSVNPGMPDVPINADCNGLDGSQGRFSADTDDGIYDLGSAEALGGSAPLFDVANGLPPLDKASVTRGTIGADWSVDWTTTEELTNVTEWAFGGRLSGTSFATEEVVPSEDVAIISVAIKIEAASGTTINLSFLDSIYSGGARPTLGDGTQNKDNFLTFYMNLAQEKIIPNLQDVTLNVQ